VSARESAVFRGDDVYTICCTGDAVVGDEICFDRAMFTGSYRRPRFFGYERVEAVIVKDAYGDEKQQHTFTLRAGDGTKMLIKGRNLYREGCWRKPWADESDRILAQQDKHLRGADARFDRACRRESDPL
jgi:hypothetical protein